MPETSRRNMEYRSVNKNPRNSVSPFVVLNEMSLLRFLWACWRGHRPRVIATLPVVSFANALFKKIAAKSISDDMAIDAIDEVPQLSYLRTLNTIVMINDVFASTEAWQEEVFLHDRVNERLADYAMAYKLVGANYVAELQTSMLLIDALPRGDQSNDIRIVGAPRCLGGLFEDYYRRPFPAKVISAAGTVFSNISLSILALVTGLAWIGSRTRICAPTPEEYFLAVDDLGDNTNVELLNEITDGGPIVLVGRVKGSPPPSGASASYRRLYASDGRFGICGAIAAVGILFRDTCRIFATCRSVDSGLFWRAAQLPLKRLMIRALLGRIRPSYFLGRDPYSPEHSLRRQELHRIGSASHGLLHGFGALTDLYPMFRYVDYDQFYVFGRDIFEIYRDRWAADMVVIPSGTFGFSRSDILNIRNAADRGTSIVVLSNVLALLNHTGFIHLIRALAENLPDVTILLQTKPTTRNMPSAINFKEACAKGLPNVVVTDAGLPELMQQAACVLSDPSTVVMEAIQLGIPAFVVDLIEGHKTCLYRKYPFLCLGTSDQAVSQISALLNGEWTFPFSDCGNLTNITEQTIFDHFREGLGLSSVGPLTAAAK
jgi:hypothetical protein